MDRYLFRGKRVDNGEWVEGWLFQNKHRVNKCFIRHFPDKDDYYEDCAVYKETIGQCTGSKDKNDKFIFEDDILKCSDNDGYEYQTKVNYGDGALTVEVVGCDYDFTAIGWALKDDIEECEIIGNIHDKEAI